MINGLCKWLVCVKGCFVWRDWLCEGMESRYRDQTPSIPPCKPFILLCITSLHTNHLSFSVLHPFTQTIPSHKPTFHTKPSLQTNYPFTQTIPSHKTSLHKNQIICNTKNDKWFLLHPCYHSLYYYYLVCVKGCNTESNTRFLWRDGLFEGMADGMALHCIAYYHPFTQTIPSHKPSLHATHPFTQCIPSYKPDNM